MTTDPLAPSGQTSATPTPAGAPPPGPPPAVAAGPGTTAWLLVFLAIFAGLLAATQVGKAHIALPAIRSDLKLSLEAGSWLISAMNFLGLFGASLVGILAARYGSRRFITWGLIVLAVFGFYGSTAATEVPLMISRFFEGVGFRMFIIGAPSLIAAVTQEKDRRFALGALGRVHAWGHRAGRLARAAGDGPRRLARPVGLGGSGALRVRRRL